MYADDVMHTPLRDDFARLLESETATAAMPTEGDDKLTRPVLFGGLKRLAEQQGRGYSLRLTVNDGHPVHLGECVRMSLSVQDAAVRCPPRAALVLVLLL
jgi:hypothetical protein